MAKTKGSSDNELSALEARLAAPIPGDLRRLFLNANFEDGPGRLMTPMEAEATQQVGVNWRGCCPFWTDENSNYAALHVAGPLSGKVCFLDHEEPDLSPVYRSLPSFLAALTSANRDGKDWYEMPTDYFTPSDYYFHQNGTPASATEMELKSDLEIAKHIRSQLDELPAGEDGERRYLCYCVIGLTPPDGLDTILEFLRNGDMWVQERAANVLGIRRYEPAIQSLADLAFGGKGNGVGAAISALGRIGTAECREALLKCLAGRAVSYAPYLGIALKACGCEATHDRGKWRYRLPGDKIWKIIN